MTNTKHPYFFDGALRIAQGDGYRAGLDAVLLAASIDLAKDKTALELGCGAGTALLCAAWRNPAAQLTGLEKQTILVQLASENANRNEVSDRVQVQKGNVGQLPDPFYPDSFDHVFFNPPYQDDSTKGNLPAQGKKEAFISDQAGLDSWIAKASILVKARGYITLIHRADRIADIISHLHRSCGDIHILPIAPRAGQKAHRVLVRGRKGVRSPSVLCPPLILHEAGKNYTKRANDIFRGKLALVF